jgi:CDGSH-type Zn-finger protein
MSRAESVEIKATKKDHFPQEVGPSYQTHKLQIKVTENGPDLVVLDGKVSFALCRCGRSASKPYCDGTHATIGFKGAASEIKIL